jgi:hypothetical protein
MVNNYKSTYFLITVSSHKTWSRFQTITFIPQTLAVVVTQFGPEPEPPTLLQAQPLTFSFLEADLAASSPDPT